MKKVLLLPFIGAMLLFNSCSLFHYFTGSDQDKISAEQLKKEMEEEKDLVVVNVLPETSYENCRIKGSISIEYDKIKEKTSSWNKDKNIIVYCASYTCKLSGMAAKILTKMGFTKVRKYEGGTKEWFDKHKDLTQGPCKGF